MTIHLEWHTRYRYSAPVRLLHTELRITPTSRFGQIVTNCAVTIEPPATGHIHHDAFGNEVRHLDFLQPVEALEVGVRADVVASAEPAPEALSPMHRVLYLQPTARAPFAPELREIAARFGGLPPLKMSWNILEYLQAEYIFEVGITDVTHTAVDFVGLRRGVCQDYSHLGLALLRLNGVPARYTSGYLAPAEGDDIGVASHAWIQVHDDGAWYGMDLANGRIQDDRYVVAAVGRDYDDVPPLRGTFHGVAEQQWQTEVRLQTAGQE